MYRLFKTTLLFACFFMALTGCSGDSGSSTGIGNASSSSSSSSSSGSSGGSVSNLYSLASFPIGVAVAAGDFPRSIFNIPEQQNTITQHFNQLTAENIMKMSYLHPTENTYTFDNADTLVNWAITNGLMVHGHTFIWHHSSQLPAWMENYSGDFAAMLDSHVTNIAEHFAGRVVSWDVVNEVIDENNNNCWRDTLFYQQLGEAYVENAFRAARAADPDADLYYNDYSIEWEPAKQTCLLQLVDGLLANNVPIDGVGFQMHVGIDFPDANTIASAFQSIVDRELKVKITELDIPVNNPYSAASFPQYTSFDSTVAELQKQRYKSIVQTYLNTVPVNLRGGISVWGLWDGDSWLLQQANRSSADDWPLLFTGPENGPYQSKPSFDGFAEALSE